ncbi:hypothetical protein KL86DES1_10547 [uncultured Desulfovibrio sp.]|uniref:Uncharacterized protein n=1 Tax=uncultured Desulfovibrio sp. TaxID=167968 RepID=A0A212KZD4_9BACT|nr:hypothetical protein KL86DES1_10547 [uncultured Desulfovibrio sp.]VZH32422.1 conserved protein of unknown function [Desulfovibrio sp. 86]
MSQLWKIHIVACKMTVAQSRNAWRFSYKYALLNFELVLDNRDQSGNFTHGVTGFF